MYIMLLVTVRVLAGLRKGGCCDYNTFIFIRTAFVNPNRRTDTSHTEKSERHKKIDPTH